MDVPYLWVSRISDGEDLGHYAPFDPEHFSRENLREEIVWLVTYRFKHPSDLTVIPVPPTPYYGIQVYSPDQFFENEDPRVDAIVRLHYAALHLGGIRPGLDEEPFLLPYSNGWSVGFIDLHHPRIEYVQDLSAIALVELRQSVRQAKAALEVWPVETREDLRKIIC